MFFCVLLIFSRRKRLGTYSKTDFSVDVAVEMPSEIFRSKAPVTVAAGKYATGITGLERSRFLEIRND